MRLFLTVAGKGKRESPRAYYEREVPWESAPDVGEIIFVGREEDGKGSSINAKVTCRGFSTDGITVEAAIEHCNRTEEYDGVCQAVVRDGFQLSCEVKDR